ncbi:hypothetical protein JCM8547_000870 [Rhodosporidiobolus lusitaniae]
MTEFNALPSNTDYLSLSPDQSSGFLSAKMRAEQAERSMSSDANGGEKASSSSFSQSPSSASSDKPPCHLTCLVDGRQLSMTLKEWEDYQAREQSM